MPRFSAAASPQQPSTAPTPTAKKQGKKRVVLLVSLAVAAFAAPIGFMLSRDEGPRVTKLTTQRAQVVKATRAAPVAAGAQCTIRVEPAKGRPFNCRLMVRCGGQVLYGAKSSNGYASCTVQDGVGTSAHETDPDDSDPDVHYDVASRTVMVKETSWQVDLEFVD